MEHKLPAKPPRFPESYFLSILVTALLLLLLFVLGGLIGYQSERLKQRPSPAQQPILPPTPNPTVNPTTGANTPTVEEGCVVGGCNGELCQDADEEPLASICLYKPEYACYKTATCERQTSGECGWTQAEELKSCLSQY